MASTQLTIDELARRAGMTARNIRAYQSRGLVPPPEVRGRTGYYGEQHLARLGLIRDMQREGFNLTAIKRVLDAAPPGSEDELLRFERALLGPWGPEEPEVHQAEELLAAFRNPPEASIRRAVDLGLILPMPDGRFEVPMPSMLRAGRELAGVGVPIERLLDLFETLLEHTRGIAEAYRTLFLDQVWRPFEERGEPAEEWPRVREALERLRPLASQAVAAAFQRTMREAVDEAFGAELERRGGSASEAV
jgi:DNA-binding transcriptional MerR regulator